MKSYWENFKKLYKFTGIMKYVTIIILALMMIDKSNIITTLIKSNYTKFILILVSVLIILRLIEMNLLSCLKIKIVNDIDAILVFTILTCLAFIPISFFINGITYRIWGTIIVGCICIFILLYRINLLKKTYENTDNKSNTYDLKDLYDGSIINDDNIILINEEDVSYDLLERDKTINHVYETIINCNPRKKFVISLEGPWGSGKTTILNIIKSKITQNNEDIIIIDEFDPWSYNDQASMFRGMFDILLKECGIKYSIAKSKSFTDNLYQALFSGKNEKKIKVFEIYNNDSTGDIKKVKEMINNYLKTSNKKIVFIIDNIDRIEKDKVPLLFKLVGNVFDFENVIYILSFDDKRILNIMKNDLCIDYDYLKKIIQLQVKVPSIDSDVKINVIEKCIKNLLILYGEKEEDLSQYNELIYNIANIIDDIRDLKRFINSVMSFYYRSNKYLNPIDTITIELIRIYNDDLYYSILKNREYFISYDKIFSREIYSTTFNKKTFNEKGKLYFEELFSSEKNKKYINLLSEIFPYVKKFKIGCDLEYDGNTIYSDDKEYKQVIKNRRVCSLKFFDLYFNKNDNDFNNISNIVDEFVQVVNSSNANIEISKRLDLIIKQVPSKYHKILFETLEFYISDIKINNLSYLSLDLFKKIYDIDDSSQFLSLSARKRATVIISEILLKLDDREFDKYIDSLRTEYSKIEIIDSIAYWIKNNRDSQNTVKDDREQQWNKFATEVGKNIYDNNINLYDEDFYYYNNIWGLYRILKDDDRDIKKYINNILTSQNIIRFLFDVTNISIGSNGYTYKINSESLACLSDIDTVNMLISERDSNTKDEEFVLKIYNHFINDIKDDSVEHGVPSNEEVRLKL